MGKLIGCPIKINNDFLEALYKLTNGNGYLLSKFFDLKVKTLEYTTFPLSKFAFFSMCWLNFRFVYLFFIKNGKLLKEKPAFVKILFVFLKAISFFSYPLT